jgi:A/G-specific adenine glycosylase
MKENKQKVFSTLLLKWNKSHNNRQMPWKGETNAYLIWLSEIILQQTRVEQGMSYFLAFKNKYPSIVDLANAPEDEVMRLWQGLGYYSRARNLHATAKKIATDFQGIFPVEYNDIIALKGIGSYTAAAITSFAYNAPYAVVDGNVVRIISRVFGIDTPFDTTGGKKLFAQLAQALLPEKSAGEYNQAIMDFGATVCTPALPKCPECPLQKICFAYEKNLVQLLPVRSKILSKRERFLTYLFIRDGEHTFIKKRAEKDIWANLYEFPLIETDILVEKGFKALIKQHFGLTIPAIDSYSRDYNQMLTHQKLHIRFVQAEITAVEAPELSGYLKVKVSALAEYAFPRTIALYLSENRLV